MQVVGLPLEFILYRSNFKISLVSYRINFTDNYYSVVVLCHFRLMFWLKSIRLILRAVDAIKEESEKIRITKAGSPIIITVAVDFFRTYADRFHHGKEEGILFNELSRKALSDADQKKMAELINEHAYARRTVTALDEAKEKYLSGDKQALNEILDLLRRLVELYPLHIEKENKHFFYPSMNYFSAQEQQSMQSGFAFFNRDFTDKRYKEIVDSLIAFSDSH
jgi:hemerythrin-like domain-containing protein